MHFEKNANQLKNYGNFNKKNLLTSYFTLPEN